MAQQKQLKKQQKTDKIDKNDEKKDENDEKNDKIDKIDENDENSIIIKDYFVDLNFPFLNNCLNLNLNSFDLQTSKKNIIFFKKF